MPRSALLSIEFEKTDRAAGAAREWEVNATWSGTPERPYPYKGYVGTLTVTHEVALRDEDGGQPYIKCRFRGIPFDGEFLARISDHRELTRQEVATVHNTVRRILIAAYEGAGYAVAQWAVPLAPRTDARTRS